MTLTTQDMTQIKAIFKQGFDEFDIKLTDLRTEMREGFAAIHDELGSVKADIFTLQQDIAHVLTSLSILRLDVNILTKRVDELTDRLDRLGVRTDEDVRAAYVDVERLRKRVTALEKGLKELKAAHAKA